MLNNIKTYNPLSGYHKAIIKLENSGVRPTNVVREVKNIGLNLLGPASKTASIILFPSLRYRLIKSTITRLSFTTTPVKATKPIIDRTEKLIPIIRCPSTAPVKPNGIEDITTRGWKYDMWYYGNSENERINNNAPICVNENYDRFNHLIELNKPLMFIGEVNNTENVPKIFPQDVFPIDEAPNRYTKQVHLRLKAESLDPNAMDGIRELAEAHPGNSPLMLCLRQSGGQSVFLETSDHFNVKPGRELQSAVNEKWGGDTYYAKADMNLPEPQKRFKKRADSGE